MCADFQLVSGHWWENKRQQGVRIAWEGIRYMICISIYIYIFLCIYLFTYLYIYLCACVICVQIAFPNELSKPSATLGNHSPRDDDVQW